MNDPEPAPPTWRDVWSGRIAAGEKVQRDVYLIVDGWPSLLVGRLSVVR